MTFVANNVLTAAQLNTHLRDNLMELAPAKASSNVGSWFFVQGPNRIEERIMKSARVDTQQNTKSSSYVDLATPGPTVTVNTGKRAIVMLMGHNGNTVGNSSCSMAFSISGETEREPSDTHSLSMVPRTANEKMGWGVTYLLEDLEPGQNTFHCKYKAGADTAIFANRFLAVIPL